MTKQLPFKLKQKILFDQQTIKTKLCRKKENSRKKKIANKQCDQKLQFYQFNYLNCFRKNNNVLH